jgi:four helix bundle protein
MTNQKSYTELEVWKQTRNLVKDIYYLTKFFPKEEQFGLISQMRRCSVSVPSNIAEGIGRRHKKDSIHFYYIARGSLYELETQCYLCYDLNYFIKEQLNKLLIQIEKNL